MGARRVAGICGTVALLLAVGAPSGSARAQPAATGEPQSDAAGAAQACVDEHVLGQQLQRKDRLLEARQSLIRCSNAACPAIVVRDCTQWLREVEARVPSLVLGATGPDGRDVVAVRTFLDGRLVSERLDGRPMEVDPGEHTLRFERAGSRPIEEHIVVQDGHRGRRVAVRFADASASSPVDTTSTAASARPIPPLAYVLGTVGFIGLGAFGTFGIIGLDQRGSLDECRGHCSDSQIDDGGRRSFLIADVSLGVGAAALVAATIVYLTRPTVASAPASATRQPRSVPGVIPF